MAKWTRRDLVKAGLTASAGAVARGEMFAAGIGAGDAGPTGESLKSAPVEAAGAAQGGLRERLLLDFDWKFALGNANDPDKDFGYGKLRREGTYAKSGRIDGPAAIDFDDAAWRGVNLPHDWAVELPFVSTAPLPEHGGKALGREYPETSVGWYRRRFQVPASDLGKRMFLEFDGIFRNATVFLNGHYLAENFSGYVPLIVDVTDFLTYGDAKGPGKNVLAVRVDASLDEGWFYEGAGIYRHAWLKKTGPVHFAQWGVYVRPVVEASAVTMAAPDARVLVTAEVTNSTDAAVRARTRVTLVDPEGKPAGSAVSSAMMIAAGATATLAMEAAVTQSKLWSVETPHLYQAVTALEVDRRAGDWSSTDREATTFGIRTVKFDADKGFLLNGKQVKLMGTCNHQDHAGVGAAVPDRIQEYRVARLQAMGSNAYRTSHNAPTPELLDACDRMGMLVMDETRMMSSNPEGLSDLERLIRRDRNHPSVVIWSLGNEEAEQGTVRGARIVKTMRALQRKLDPSRVSTLAMNDDWGGVGASTTIDVQGTNYRTGKIDAFHKANPRLPMVGTETASTLATRGIYANNTTRGYMAAYDINKPEWGATAEEWWSFFGEREWLAGGFAWTGFDYRGEPTPYSWPCISSHFGIMDTCGFAKDDFYYYRAWWGTAPSLHVFPHWNWEGKEGQEIEVWAFCNQDSVELFLNGKSQGTRSVKKFSHVMWKVKYEPGTIEARASKGGQVTLTEKRETAGTAARIIATAHREQIAADGEDVSIVDIRVVDAQGRDVPLAANLVTFGVRGPGTVTGVGNGDPSSHEPDKATQRSAFNGLCMAVVQSKRGAPGTIEVRCSAPGLAEANIAIKSEIGTLRPLA